jgi:hypothetical protein
MTQVIRRTKGLRKIWLVWFLWLPTVTAFSQSEESFHVTVVTSGEATDWCQTGKCTATRYTVEGYTKSVAYVLECVEVFTAPPDAHISLACAKVAAGKDYRVKVFPTSINFVDAPKPDDSRAVASQYTIRSQKER